MKLGVQVGLGPGHIVSDGDLAPYPQRGTAPHFSSHICCGQMAGWIKMPFGMEVGLGTFEFVLDGDPAPSPKRVRSPPPNFRPMSTIMAKRLDGSRFKMALGMEVGVGPCDIVRWDPAPPEKGHSPPVSAHVYCGQMAGWIKVPLGLKVGLGPCHSVLDGHPASPRKGHSSPLPLFGPCLLWPQSPMSATVLSSCSSVAALAASGFCR